MNTMNIPMEIIMATLSVIGFLAVKSVYGTIERNKADSDAADEKTDIKIDKLEDKIQANFEKFVNNDRELYKASESVKIKQAYDDGYKDGFKDRP